MHRSTTALVMLLLAVVTITITAGSTTAAGVVDGNWLSFGRTSDNNRHSPLTAISPANVSTLGRVYSLDLQKIDPDIRRGEQSFPLAVNGVLYVTTNDNNVFAIDGASGKVLWQYKPTNSGFFKNFGVVANRGLSYCDGKLFMTQLDMSIVALRPSDGHLLGKVAISQYVPNAAANYGYSETSAPICANHRLVVGAAGSEYGIRGFVMAFTTDLQPAWPTPYWTIPPERQLWRRQSRIVGGGAVWTPVTIDAKTATVYFGTGGGTPNFFPQLRPGPNPRANSLVAVDLRTGQQHWWQQLVANDQWNYDVAQPPLVYDAKIGGKTRHVVSVATKEGVWFAFDAATGAPFHERVKVIDRVEHPALRPGEPVTIFPSPLGGVNYSPASYDPATGYVFNAAAETAAVLIQSKLTPTQKKRKFVEGDVYLGVSNGNFGTELAGWHDHGSISAIDVSTGRRVWKFETPEPERGGVTTTASGIGFDGGGDGVLRAFDLKTGKMLWTFQTGRQIAGGPTLFTANGTEYLAITAGGSPTSSGGGLAALLQVFALGASQKQSAPPQLASRAAPAGPLAVAPVVLGAAGEQIAGIAPARTLEANGPIARIVTPASQPVAVWTAASNNTKPLTGRLLLGSAPVQGAVVAVDRYRVPVATNAQGGFTIPVDVSLARRHVVQVVAASAARVGGRRLTADEQARVMAATGGINVAYALSDLHAKVIGNGNIEVTGRATYGAGLAPPQVSLFTYRLSGTITDATGKAVAGATVVTRTQDRDFWTFSDPSDANGHYTSFFAAADETTADPVPLSVQVAVGQVSYTSGLNKNVDFKRLNSATLDIKLPASSTALLPLPTSSSYPGAVYEGVLIGVSGPTGVIKPVAARWPDAQGRFRLVLPAAVKGKTLHFWESTFQSFSSFAAAPGGPVDLSRWPAALSPRVPRGVESLRAPG